MKTKSCLLRLTEHECSLFSVKSKILGTNKSELFRNGAFHYWGSHKEPDFGGLLKLYQEGSDEDKAVLVDILFEYYRLTGYPHHNLSNEELKQKMRTLAVTKDPLLEDDHLQSNTTGIELANHFHPHMAEVRCLTNNRSAYDQYIDDDLLKDAINRWMELDKKPNPSGLRRILRTRDGVRSVVNFKPAIAKYFYENYCSSGDRILDPCMGYGGRLAGCIASNKGIFYHGIDVDSRSCIGNVRLAGFYNDLINNDIEKNREWLFKFKMDMGCAEDVMRTLPDNAYELIFSSPPFFLVEKYSLDPAQSYLRYPEYDLWRDKFLFTLVRESFRLCKRGGHLILNLKDYKKYPIASDACRCAKNIGFELVKTYHQRMSNSEYNRRENQIKYHTEPIFVWLKD